MNLNNVKKKVRDSVWYSLRVPMRDSVWKLVGSSFRIFLWEPVWNSVRHRVGDSIQFKRQISERIEDELE
jgi:hypothetical protein